MEPGTRYTVKAGDTLWDLAQAHLGNPERWPEIHAHNNRPEIVALTNSRIVDPDLIFVGQTLYLPNGDAPPPNLPQPRPGAGKRPARRQVYSIPFKFSLPDLPAITVVSPTHTATIKLKGSVTLQSEKTIDFLSLTRDEIVVSAKREADLALQRLVSDTKISLNPGTGQLKLEMGLTIHSDSPYTPSTSVSTSLSPTGQPCVTSSIKAPPLKGKVLDHLYHTENLSFEVEVCIRGRRPGQRRVPQPRPGPVRQPQPQRGPSTWDYLVAGALVTAATVLVVATVAEDIVTLGAGTVDDPVSFATASAAIAVAVNRLQTVPGTTPVKVEGGGRAPSDL